jgi:glycogen synthase
MTGGLADVVGSLPAAFTKSATKWPSCSPSTGASRSTRSAASMTISLSGWGELATRPVLYQSSGPVPYYFLDCPELYQRAGLYGNLAR